jgi:hypothetical protein
MLTRVYTIEDAIETKTASKSRRRSYLSSLAWRRFRAKGTTIKAAFIEEAEIRLKVNFIMVFHKLGIL